MGSPEPASVSGSAYDVIGKEQAKLQSEPFSTEDMACGMVKFKNGATLLVEASWALNIDKTEYMITQLYGDKGSAVQKNENGTYEMTAEVYTAENGFFYKKQLDHVEMEVPSLYEQFVASIVHNQPPAATADEGIKVQKILDGLYESAATGTEVVYE